MFCNISPRDRDHQEILILTRTLTLALTLMGSSGDSLLPQLCRPGQGSHLEPKQEQPNPDRDPEGLPGGFTSTSGVDAGFGREEENDEEE